MELKEYRVIDRTRREKEPGWFSYEYISKEVYVVVDEVTNFYLRIKEKSCTSEANGRPVTYYSEYCYPIENQENISKNNWESFITYGTQITISQWSKEGVV